VDEALWLGCTDPEQMLAFLEGKLSTRKQRFFACACVRSAWRLLRDSRSHKAIEIGERYADGLVDENERHAVCEAAWGPYGTERGLFLQAVRAAHTVAESSLSFSHKETVYAARWAAATKGWSAPAPRPAQAAWLRDVIGNPYRPVVLDPAWRTHTVIALAQAAYDDRSLPSGTLDPDRLAVLADALEDAGCDNADVLSHLRGPGPHVRGCWPLDLMLAKR